jgi:hypothetical protein
MINIYPCNATQAYAGSLHRFHRASFSAELALTYYGKNNSAIAHY